MPKKGRTKHGTRSSSARRIKVKASRRALNMLADQAIGNDLMKGFLELITNSDESYARLEVKGAQVDGRIQIEGKPAAPQKPNHDSSHRLGRRYGRNSVGKMCW